MFKDYICNPKTNMYRSLHTTVFGPDDRLVQTQIRTYDMDKIASFGLTAYWDIEKGNARDKMQEELKNKYQFFKSLVEINKVFADNQEFVSQVQKELLSDKIYVYTTKGEVIELPKGATAIDFAYRIHSDLGDTMVSAVVNDKMVGPEYVLHNKDRVRILTDLLSYGPREEWLEIVQTTKAKRRIRELNKKQE
jgi:GTP pyrophosphokinase